MAGVVGEVIDRRARVSPDPIEHSLALSIVVSGHSQLATPDYW
jgi:hypothetical protein